MTLASCLTDYRAPAWLPGAQLQTIWPALRSRFDDGCPATYTRERWTTPDGDFIDVDLQPSCAQAASASASASAPWLVLFHGLEGSSRSPYALAFACAARQLGWHYAVAHFRGCSGELNLAPRAYHSGDFEEIDWILARTADRAGAPVCAVGVSLGGNALLRWAEEMGDEARHRAHAVAAVCAPLDLAASGRAIGRGFNRRVYTPMFLRSMKPKALAKLAQYPGLFDERRLRAARDLYEFDDVFTAPLHGFLDTDDYWRRASARPRLRDLRIPTLLLNARNDPFVPAASLPGAAELPSCAESWQPAQGGHVGFAEGRFPGEVLSMPRRVCAWLQAHRPSAIED